MSNVRNRNLFIYIQAWKKIKFQEKIQKKISEFVQSGFAEGPVFQKKIFFHLFIKKKSFKNFYVKLFFVTALPKIEAPIELADDAREKLYFTRYGQGQYEVSVYFFCQFIMSS